MSHLCDHISALIENSADAQSSRISVFINENSDTDELEIIITDNGNGMTQPQIKASLNPFFSSKGKKAGLGLSLFGLSVKQSGGELFADSLPGYGTVIRAIICLSNINRESPGDISRMFYTVMDKYPSIGFIYEHRANEFGFYIDCGQMREKLIKDGIPYLQIIRQIQLYIKENERNLYRRYVL